MFGPVKANVAKIRLIKRKRQTDKEAQFFYASPKGFLIVLFCIDRNHQDTNHRQNHRQNLLQQGDSLISFPDTHNESPFGNKGSP